MLTSQDHWNQVRIQRTALIADIQKCLLLLFENNQGETQVDWEEEGMEPFNLTTSPNYCVKGIVKEIEEDEEVIYIWCEDRRIGCDVYKNIDEEDFEINDHIGILERLQTSLDELGVDYKNL